VEEGVILAKVRDPEGGLGKKELKTLQKKGSAHDTLFERGKNQKKSGKGVELGCSGHRGNAFELTFKEY